MAASTSDALSSTIDDLPTIVGRSFGPSSWLTVTQADIQAYAELSGDFNPIHLDPEVARQSGFAGTIAHGFLTLSKVVPLMAEVFEVTGFAVGINYGVNKLRFPTPVPSGSRIRLSGTVASVTEVPGGYQIQTDLVFEVEGSAKPACFAELLLRFTR